MRKRLFSDIDKNVLSKNINVLRVSSESITYQPILKLTAVMEYQSRKAPMEIFRDAGLDIDMIGRKVPNNSLARWRKVYKKLGEDGLLRDTRGKSNTVSNLELSILKS